MSVKVLSNGIIWDDAEALGYYPVDVDHEPYDEKYFEKYVGYAETERGRKITEKRIALVANHVATEPVVDIGIGAGQFVSTRPHPTFGYDVNPHGIQWLLDRRRWWDPWFREMPHATFWDSLEHFKEPRDILARCRGYAFISIPIFTGPEHASTSKHFKQDEHFWYFTRPSLEKFMSRCGFTLMDVNEMETELGREDIGTFVFRRFDR